MNTNNMQPLIDAAITIAARGAREYLNTHKLTAESDALAACLKAMVKFRLPEALRDAREALACNMGQAAEMTFAATMLQAGIDAAKEAGFPAEAVSAVA